MNTDRKLVISSYKKGLPRLGLLIQVAFVCGIPIAILVYGGFTITTVNAFPFSGWLATFFFSCSVVIGIIAIWNLIPESVEINDYGIKITRGWKNKEATWSEISELRGKYVIEYVSRHSASTRPAIVVKTERWKHTIVERRYSTKELKNVFISVAEHVTPIGAIIEDELGWLPERLYPREKVYLGRMRGYALLSKVGLLMLSVGAILSILGTFGEIYGIAGLILMFIGVMCLLCGGLGYFDEKKKLGTNK